MPTLVLPHRRSTGLRPWAPSSLPTRDDVSRRTFVAGGLALGLLVACGDDGGDDRAASTRTIGHASGTIQIPSPVGRLVTMDTISLSAALVIGVTPVASAADKGLEEDVPLREFDVSGIEPFALVDPSLEVVTGARPDVIVAPDYWPEEAQYDELSAIAPVVLMGFDLSTDDGIRLVGDVVERADEAEAAIAEYAERAATTAAVVDASVLGGAAVAIAFDTTTDDTYRVLGSPSYAGRAMAELGVGTVLDAGGSDAADAQYGGDDISAEELGLLAPADVVFLVRQPDRQPGTGIEANPLWTGLPAVQSGRVAYVPRVTFYTETAVTRLVRLDEIEQVARTLG